MKPELVDAAFRRKSFRKKAAGMGSEDPGFIENLHALDKDDICIMLDRTCKETGQNQLCRVVKRLSDRTFVVEYSQKLYKLCPKTFKVIRGAKKFQVNRPIQNLVLVTRGGQMADGVNIDPYI